MNEVLLKTEYPDGTPLKVFKEDGTYYWEVNGLPHMVMDTLTLPENESCLHGSLIESNLIKNQNSEVLIGGIGFGNTVETLKRFDNIKVDVVEINKDVIDFYKKNYEGKPIADNIYLDDFKDFITNTDKKYDGIFMQLDFFGLDKKDELYSLCTETNIEMYNKEFFTQIYNRLKNKGYFLLDVLSTSGNFELSDLLNDIGFYATAVEQELPDRPGVCFQSIGGYKCQH